jgi:hypothetical protein
MDAGKRYIYREEPIGVTLGLDGANWIVARRAESGGLYRINSKYLPPCASRERMQERLDLWAERKSLEVAADPAPVETTGVAPGREVYEGGLAIDHAYLLKDRGKPEKARKALYVGVNGGKHVFLCVQNGSVTTEKKLSSAALCHYEIREYAS